MRVETVRGAMAVDGLGTTLDRIKDMRKSVEWGAPL
jgi:hypothetical protein